MKNKQKANAYRLIAQQASDNVGTDNAVKVALDLMEEALKEELNQRDLREELLQDEIDALKEQVEMLKNQIR